MDLLELMEALGEFLLNVIGVLIVGILLVGVPVLLALLIFKAVT